MSEFANFPYEIVETTGERALATWEELKIAGRGAPVVLGGDHHFLFPFDPMSREEQQPIEKILAAADAINFPEDLRRLQQEEEAKAMTQLAEIASQVDLSDFEHEPPLGEWPIESAYGWGLSIAEDFKTSQFRPVVRIALIPTDDPTAIPAYMRWGDWNSCPHAAYHVAALRAWRDRYGAELIGLGSDTINLRVSRKPATREEALELARAQYVYCNDIIDQGVGSYRELAAGLMASDWWFFWWD